MRSQYENMRNENLALVLNNLFKGSECILITIEFFDLSWNAKHGSHINGFKLL